MSSFSSSSKASTELNDKSNISSIIALSTDQVYDGKTKTVAKICGSNTHNNDGDGNWYTEDESDRLYPVNVYGRTKLEMERYLIEKLKNGSGEIRSFILRSSIIFGPNNVPILPHKNVHKTFFDFVKSCGSGNQQTPTTFFTNEYRNIVRLDYIQSVLNDIIIKHIIPKSNMAIAKTRGKKIVNDISQQPKSGTPVVVFNMGGPYRVNRIDMAKAVFDYYSYDTKLLLPTEQTSELSPLDISMDSSLVTKHGFGNTVISCCNINEKYQTNDEAKKEYLKKMVQYVFQN